MKKILAILLALTVALALTGCKKEEAPTPDAEPTVAIEDGADAGAAE